MVIRKMSAANQQTSRLSSSQPLEESQLRQVVARVPATKQQLSTHLVQLDLTDVRLPAKREDEKEPIL